MNYIKSVNDEMRVMYKFIKYYFTKHNPKLKLSDRFINVLIIDSIINRFKENKYFNDDDLDRIKEYTLYPHITCMCKYGENYDHHIKSIIYDILYLYIKNNSTRQIKYYRICRIATRLATRVIINIRRNVYENI